MFTISLRLFFTLLLLVSLSNSYSQLSAYSIKQYTVNDGLPINNVRHITKDNNGFYWILTSIGLARFDGESIEPISYPVNSNTRIPYISNVKITKNNKIFYKYSDTLTYYVDSNSQIRKQEFKRTPFFKNLWFGELELTFKYEDLKKVDSNAYKKIEESIQLNKIIYAHQITDSSFYLICANGAYYISQHKIKHLSNFITGKSYYFSVSNYFVYCNNTKYLLFKDDKLINEGANSLKNELDSTFVLDILTYEIKDKCFLSLNDKLYEAKINSKFELEYEKKIETTNFKILNCFVDETDESIFLSTFNNGFFRYKKNIFKNIKLLTQHKTQNVVYSLALNKKNEIFTNDDCLKFIYKNNIQTGYEFVGPVCYLKDESLLVSTFRDLYLVNKHFTSFQKINTKAYEFREILLTDSVVYILANTLTYYKYATKKILEKSIFEWPNNGKHIYTMCKSNKKNCLFIVRDSKLEEINFEKNTTTVLANKIPNSVRSLYYDSSNAILFISTKGNGLYIYTEKKGVEQLTMDDQKALYYCHYVLQDKDRDYWIPTNTGLILMRNADLLNYLYYNKPIKYTRYGSNDGILNEEFNGGFSGGGVIYGDTIALASMNGVVIFNTNIKNKQKLESGVLMIDEVNVDGKKNITNTILTLEPSFKQLLVKASYPSINRKSIEIQYRLIGGNDTSWFTVNKNGWIDIKNLRAGNYILEIKVDNNLKQFKKIDFKVLPYWYNTWWASTIFILCIIVGFYIIFMWRLNHKKNAILALQDAQRNKMLTTIAHDLRTPMNNFVHFVDTMKFLIKQKDFETIEAIGNELDKKGRNLQLFLNNILSWSSNKNLNVVKKEKVNLEAIINELLPVYSDIAKFRNIDIKLSANPNNATTFISDINLITIILRNVIDNAIKYAPNNSTIKIQLYNKNKQHGVAITNTTTEQAEKIANTLNAIFKRKFAPTPYDNNVGFGTSIVYESLQQLNGDIRYQGNKDELILELLF